MRCGECDRRAIDGACGRELQVCPVDEWASMPIYSPMHECHFPPRTKRTQRNSWTEEEDRLLVDYRLRWGDRWVASATGRSIGAVRRRASALGVLW